jgi:hypothetical protein
MSFFFFFFTLLYSNTNKIAYKVLIEREREGRIFFLFPDGGRDRQLQFSPEQNIGATAGAKYI